MRQRRVKVEQRVAVAARKGPDVHGLRSRADAELELAAGEGRAAV